MTYSVLRRIEELAFDHGDRVAMEEGPRRLTYAGLYEAIRRAGRQGLSRPAPGLVGINGRPSIEAGVGILGAMASGDVAVPVDGRLPLARQQALLAWCDTLSDQRDIAGIVADLDGKVPQPDPAGCIAPRLPRQAAYIAFTSGTTGEPKAIEGTMEGLDHFMAWQSGLVGSFCAAPRVSWLTPLSFDVMYRDLLLPLVTGGTLVIPDAEAGFNIASGWQWLTAERIDIAHVVPSIVSAWLASGDLPHLDVRALFFAGEPLTVPLVAALRRRYAGRVYNLYGPSEGTMAKFCRRIDDGCPTRGALYPVGRPIGDDVTFELAENGEIVLASPYLTNGYRRRDGAADPFPQVRPGWYAYRTGDRGEVVGGDLFLLGRLDTQMKINGIRIEAGEVERLAEACEGVTRAVAVKLSPPEAPGETLALFWQGAPDREPALREQLSDALHPAVMPSLYTHRASFPVTLNGKVDRKALAADAAALLAEGQADPGEALHGDPAERHVQQVISQVLRRPCGLDTDFIGLGGNSLMFGLIALQLETAFGIAIPQPRFYEAGTPRAIAAWFLANGGRLRRTGANADKGGAPASPEAAEGTYRPLTSRQQTIFDIFCKDIFGAAINMILQMPFRAAEAERLKRVLLRLIELNDCFHLRFRREGDTLLQALVPGGFGPGDFEEIEADDAEFDRRSTLFGERTFDLDGERPFRILLLTSPSGAGRLILSMHHLISDGMSREYIRRDIEDALAGAPVPVRGPFRSAIAAETGESRARAAAFWHAHIAGAPPMPRFVSGPDRKNLSARMLTVPLGVDHDALLAHARALNASVFPYLMAHFYRAMAAHSGASDLIIRVTTHGRYRPELLDTLGLLFSAVPLRIDGAGQGTPAIVAGLSRMLEAAREHQDVCFRDLARLVGEPDDEHVHPVTGVSFALDGYDVSEAMPAGLSLDAIPQVVRASLPHEALVFARTYSDGCVLRFLYRSKAFSDADIRAIAAHMRETILQELAEGARETFAAAEIGLRALQCS